MNRQLKPTIFVLNQIFEIEKKVKKLEEKNSINRNIKKIKDFFINDMSESVSLIIDDPTGEKYSETRTDVEANISGNQTEDLIIVDVVKPIIRIQQGKTSQVVQKGIVIVESKKGEENE
jgi:hypothetical protein